MSANTSENVAAKVGTICRKFDT